MAAGISMPDEAREVVFPAEVPVRMLEENFAGKSVEPVLPVAADESKQMSTLAEGDLGSEDEQLKQQGRNARIPEEGAGLLPEGLS